MKKKKKVIIVLFSSILVLILLMPYIRLSLYSVRYQLIGSYILLEPDNEQPNLKLNSIKPYDKLEQTVIFY